MANFKDELKGAKILTEFVALKPKMYSHMNYIENNSIKNVKIVTKELNNSICTIFHNDYKKCLYIRKN